MPNSAVAPVRPACGTCAALLQSLGRPGCSGRRNCNVNLDELRGDRPDLDYEPQQAGGIPRNVQLDETAVVGAVVEPEASWGGNLVVGGGHGGGGLATVGRHGE